MPLIQKKRIWWDPVPGATAYVVYVSTEGKLINPARLSWRDTPGMISKLVVDGTELVLREDWPEFPITPGTYHIAVTARDDAGNESDPLLLIGSFSFIAPATPSKGGVDILASTQLCDASASLSTGEVKDFPSSQSVPETPVHIPAALSAGEVKDFPLPHPEPATPDPIPASNRRTLIARGMEGMTNNEEIGDAYFPQKPGEINKWISPLLS